ncbi:hypothetical protein AHAS_Ahas11G0264500 [Arachis hypogaea]
MATESDRMEFRRYFILVVLKIFNWPLHNLKWLDKAVEKYKLKGNKTCEGCMFVVLVLYFQRLKHNQLDNCHEPKPWLAAWTTENLEKKSTYILFEVLIYSTVSVCSTMKFSAVHYKLFPCLTRFAICIL